MNREEKEQRIAQYNIELGKILKRIQRDLSKADRIHKEVNDLFDDEEVGIDEEDSLFYSDTFSDYEDLKVDLISRMVDTIYIGYDYHREDVEELIPLNDESNEE